jgi:hypothetical protein
MNLHPESQSEHQVTILFELISEGSNEVDLALVNAVGRDVTNALQNDGALVQSVETGAGARGGEFLVQVITTVTTIAADAWAYKDAFEHVLNDAGSLVTICTGVTPLLQRLFQSHKQRAGQYIGTTLQPLKITLEIDGAPVTIEANDVEQAEAALKVAQRFYRSHPDVAKKVTPQSNVKVKGSLPGQPQRKRR